MSLVEFRGLALFKFLVMPRGMQDLRSLTRDGTCAHALGVLIQCFSFSNGVGEHFNLNRQRDSILEIHSFSVAKWLRMLGSTRQNLIVTLIPLFSSLCPWASGFTSTSSSVKGEQLFTLQSVKD